MVSEAETADSGWTLVTGATGFIGRRLVLSLKNDGLACRLLARHPLANEGIQGVDLVDKTGLLKACTGVSQVFHCAGYAHAFSSMGTDEAEKHWRINFEGARNLADAAGQEGVRSFVFLSSVKAMAEPGVICIDEEFQGEPPTAYGRAKRAAEEAVLAAGRQYGMHVAILRLAMVYGSGGKGNLERMMRMIRRGYFPPLPETGNHRSLVHVDDVVSAMRAVAGDPRANGRTYIITGAEAPSGRALFDAIRAVLGMPRCHWSFPEWSLTGAARAGDILQRLLGKNLPFNSETLERLLGSAWYSGARIEKELNWQAKVSLQEGLKEMCGQ